MILPVPGHSGADTHTTEEPFAAGGDRQDESGERAYRVAPPPTRGEADKAQRSWS